MDGFPRNSNLVVTRLGHPYITVALACWHALCPTALATHLRLFLPRPPMSALAAALAAFASSPSRPVLDALAIDEEDASPSTSPSPGMSPVSYPGCQLLIHHSPATPSSCYSALPSLTNSSCGSSSVLSSLRVASPNLNTRRNEHLAVLLPKNLWKVLITPSFCGKYYSYQLSI
jgi:hypothetical protein